MSDYTERRVVASRLREARTTLGLSQQEVAAAVGMPRPSVSELETGKRGVTGLELRRLARLYRRPVGWLLGDDDPPPDGALAAVVAELSPADRAAVLAFAWFLDAQTRPAEPPPVPGVSANVGP